MQETNVFFSKIRTDTDENTLISCPDLVLAVRGQKKTGEGGGEGRGGNEIWQNTNRNER